ncbi:MAG: restriction endonuclease [Candidatus Nezhaarchaeales archaeon]
MLAKLLLSLLDSGPATFDELSLRLKSPREELADGLARLERAGLIVVEGGAIKPLSRALLAAEAIRAGASLLELAPKLSWRDFEALCSKAFEAHGYRVATSLRFRSAGRLYEVDVAASRGGVLVAVDCKSWRLRAGKAPQLRRAVDRHLERAEALAGALPGLRHRLGLPEGVEVLIVPCLVTLLEESVVLYRGVPVVPTLKLNSFIQELHSHLDSLTVLRSPP